MTVHLLAAEAPIDVNHHVTATIAGLTFNLDTIWSTALAGAVVLAMGFYLRAKATSGVPGRVQLLWETVVSWVRGQVEANIGPTAPYVVPLAVTLFFLILIANWIEILPSADLFPSPTSDTNMTYAMAFFVVVWAHIDGIRKRGVKDYIKHFFQPFPLLFPINLVEELMKPVSLALRLFGNLFAGGLMIGLIALFPAFLVPIPNAAWKLFDMFIGVIQAFIFALLTILYFGFLSSTEERH